MQKIDLLNKLTSNNIRIQDKADDLDVQKQTFYNYIKYFENGEQAKIPDVVRDYFILVMDGTRAGTTVEDAEKFWDSKFQYVAAVNRDLNGFEIESKQLRAKLTYLESEIIEAGDEATDLLNERELTTDRIKKVDLEIGRLKEKKKALVDDLKKKTIPKEPTTQCEKDIDEALFNSPYWHISESLVESIPVRGESGEYVIMFNHDSIPAKADIFAAIGGKLVKIATYRNKENENFISFRIPGDLDFFYKLTVYSEGGPYSSDIVKL